jgi:hypothetical protein
MKIVLSCLLFACALISANAQSVDPSVVLKEDGVLRITDGSTYYEFRTNGTFKSFPVGISGRCFTGKWTSSASPSLLHLTVIAEIGWINGIQPPPSDWKIVFTVYPGVRHPADRFHRATFDCYWIIDMLVKIPTNEEPNTALEPMPTAP